MEERIIKIILIGESGVGKTNLINVLFGKEFNPNTSTTYNSYFFEGIYKDTNNNEYNYTIWDTAGQEQYRSLNKIFIKDAKIIICVYAINNKDTYNEIEFWINYVKEILGEDQYILALCANKSDLYEKQEVPDEDGQELANKYNIKFNITSALTNINGFRAFLYELINDYIQLDKTKKNNIKNFQNNNSFKINSKPIKKSKKGKCCSFK